jgi:hypothetical protein
MKYNARPGCPVIESTADVMFHPEMHDP